MADTIDITPNYEGMRRWLREVAKTDLIAAVSINEELKSEGIERDDLVQIFNEWHPKTPAVWCPQAHLVVKEPTRYTFQGAAEFYCDECQSFFQDFDYGDDEGDEDDD